MPLNFTVVATNPNDTTGGGGSLAGPMHDVDATGPYFIWPNQEFDSGASPFCVVAASEVRAMAAALDREPLVGGEIEYDTSTRVLDPVSSHTGQGSGGKDEVDFNDGEAFARALKE